MPRSRSRSRYRSKRLRRRSRDSIASKRYRDQIRDFAGLTLEDRALKKYRDQVTDFAGFNENKSYIPSSISYRGERAKQVKDHMRYQHWLNKSIYSSAYGPGQYSRQTPLVDEMLSKLGKSHERKSPRSKPRSM